MKRREFIAASAAVAASSLLPNTPAWARARKVRLGLIGTGMRGQVLLKELVRRDDVEVVALCDIEPIMLKRGMDMVAKAGKPAPKAYGQDGDVNAWKRLIEQRGLDGVVIATPWEYHAPMAIAAMQAKVAVGCEVVAGITLQDHWDVLKTQVSTGTPYMLLENVCYRRDVMAALQMVRQGLFGELVHLQGGYQHDLRGVKFNSGDPSQPYDSGVEFGAKGWSEARWRTEHSVQRNGELYPSHGIGPCAMYTGINRGNRFTHINAFASKARGLHEYTVAKSGGTTHPSTKVNFKLGEPVHPHRRPQPAAQVGAVPGLPGPVRAPAVEAARRHRRQRRPRWHGLVRHPCLRGGAQGPGTDADRHLRRGHLERDHAAVRAVDRQQFPDAGVPGFHRRAVEAAQADLCV